MANKNSHIDARRDYAQMEAELRRTVPSEMCPVNELAAIVFATGS
jgi:hypothetical protein